MEAKVLREKTLSELLEIEKERRSELFKVRMQHYTGQLIDVTQLRKLRGDVARVATLIKVKRVEADLKELVKLSENAGSPKLKTKVRFLSKYSEDVKRLNSSQKKEISKMLASLKRKKK